MIISDKNFVRGQIAASVYAGTTISVLIKSVVEALDRLEIEHTDDDKIEQWVADAVSLFRGQPIVIEDEREWVGFNLGEVSIRETVRVRPDAYTGAAAIKHNGRVGTVIGTQGRKFSVRYEDKTKAPFDPVLHEHTALQKLVK